jgi:hypothetical protein
MKKLLLFLIFILLLSPIPSFAQEIKPVVLEPIPGVTTGNLNFSSFLQGSFKVLLGLGAMLAFLMLTIGGVQYMTSEALHSKEDARAHIRNALLGLLLLFGSVLILQTINPNLLQFKLDSIRPTSSQSGTSPR